MVKQGKLAKAVNGGVWVFVPLSKSEESKSYRSKVLVELDDGETITHPQRKKIYSLLGEIANWWIEAPEETKRAMKVMFMQDHDGISKDMDFSLADCSKDLASDFITWLIDTCISNGVPCHDPLWTLCEDLEAYSYSCLKAKTCAVCGRGGELHHMDAVGMGRDRRSICHLGMNVLPLCRGHHIEVHSIGKEAFLRKYHLQPIKVTMDIAKAWKLSLGKDFVE